MSAFAVNGTVKANATATLIVNNPLLINFFIATSIYLIAVIE
jgi:hypothetical protein